MADVPARPPVYHPIRILKARRMQETMARYLALNSATYRCDLALPVLYFVSIEVAANLLRTFAVIASPLLDLAVSRELGDAICQERDERPADDYRRELHHKTVDCTK